MPLSGSVSAALRAWEFRFSPSSSARGSIAADGVLNASLWARRVWGVRGIYIATAEFREREREEIQFARLVVDSDGSLGICSVNCRICSLIINDR